MGGWGRERPRVRVAAIGGVRETGWEGELRPRRERERSGTGKAQTGERPGTRRRETGERPERDRRETGYKARADRRSERDRVEGE